MKAIMVMFDSLRRDLLESYGCDWTITPNFKRLADRSIQFEQCYAGSLPCIPARRELHTGRANFLHRDWGPVEPFDDSMPELLKNAGVYTHLVSDHMHYWGDGGATYAPRYHSWECSRGQMGDAWKPDLSFKNSQKTIFKSKTEGLEYPSPAKINQDLSNRRFMMEEDLTPQAKTFAGGLEFIHRNHGNDNWFLQIETFDPHEPFFSLKDDQAMYPDVFLGDAAEFDYDWPPYAQVAESDENIKKVRYSYASLLTKCDKYLGKVLDVMDQYDLWKDTMLIVNTDHGFLLSEHGWWGKSCMPCYDEIVHLPLYVYDPRRKEFAGQKRYSIVQTVDIPATLLEFFQVEIPEDMEGRPLCKVIEREEPIRNYAVFGLFGSQINVTDGRYVYMLSEKRPEIPLYAYTLMPTHMMNRYTMEELRHAELSEPFSFTKKCPVLKIPTRNIFNNTSCFGTNLYDLQTDLREECPIQDERVEKRMRSYLREFMKKNDAPPEAYVRYGLEKQEDEAEKEEAI
ncbi:MAG: sulfatase [Candidatus Limivivens sp.]|nr:sulfatase [Candidatus Limivivens sp.]